MEIVALVAAGVLLAGLLVALRGWARAEVRGRDERLAAGAAEIERLQAQLARERERVELFHRAGAELTAGTDPEALAAVALRLLGDASEAEVGVLHAEVASDGPLHPVASRGVGLTPVPGAAGDPGRVGGAVRGQGLAGRALAEGRAVTAAAPDGVEVAGAGRVRHEVYVPLRLGDRTAGVAWLGRLGDRAFAPDELATVERLASQVAVALASVQTYARAVRQARLSRAVLDATPDPVVLFDLDGRVVVENAPLAALRVTGAVAIDTPGDDPGREGRDELAPGADGRILARHAAPVRDGAGAVVGRIVVLRDVTAERQSERVKDEFFSLVSHELRTPLTSIAGLVELVLDDDRSLSAETQQFLEVVERNVKRLLRLVDDMLFVAKVEAGGLALDRSAVDLGEVAAEAVDTARPAAERDSVGLVFTAEPVRPLTGDRDRFRQMLDNLVSNALKFSPSGGHVEVALSDRGDHAVLEIRDEGMGIPADEQRHLFERFFRSSNATDRAVPGAGLGLTIVKAIVDAHGGDIAVASVEGAGATFRVELPYPNREEADATVAPLGAR